MVAAVGGGVALTGVTKTLHNSAGASDQLTLPIGMNLAPVADWEAGFPFLNVMWGARIWLSRNVGGGGPFETGLTGDVETDSNGYPLEIPFVSKGSAVAQEVFTLLPNNLTKGRFVILHDGIGSFVAGGGTRITDVKPGRVEIWMSHGALIEMIGIRRSQKGNHVRNIRILPISHEKTDLSQNPFRPELLEFCKPWHCLRFGDWLAINNNINAKWADRKRLTFYTQTGVNGDAIGLFGPKLPDWQTKWSSGISIELCVQLANLTDTDAWLCVPHLADDEYILEMAKLVRSQLNPSRRVYLEFSNELWNWGFSQSQWMLRSELAADLLIANGEAMPWKDGRKPTAFANGVASLGAGEGTNHPERTAALFRRCFKIWEDVFAGADRQRLVRVCAVQAAWADTAQRTLNSVMKAGGCDALSPSGYFAPDETIYRKWQEAGSRLTDVDVIEDMRGVITTSKGQVAGLAAMAKKANVGLVVYEGGQHIQPLAQAATPYNAALGLAQKHPVMYDLYRANLNLFAEAGCSLFCAYSSVGEQGSRFGSWGHIERYGQMPAAAPKYRAILDANTARAIK